MARRRGGAATAITPKLLQQQRRPSRIDVGIEMDGIVVGGMTFPIDPKRK
jgi:hypothetical protein